MASSWLDNKFKKKLQDFQHEHDKALAKVSAQIEGALSATVKFQKKEIEALSQCWEKAGIALATAESLTSGFEETPDPTLTDKAAIKDYMTEIDVSAVGTKQVNESSNPIVALRYLQRSRALNGAFNDWRNLRSCLQINEIYIEEETASIFNKISDAIYHALYRKKISLYYECNSDYLKLNEEARGILETTARVSLDNLAPVLRSKFSTRL